MAARQRKWIIMTKPFQRDLATLETLNAEKKKLDDENTKLQNELDAGGYEGYYGFKKWTSQEIRQKKDTIEKNKKALEKNAEEVVKASKANVLLDEKLGYKEEKFQGFYLDAYNYLIKQNPPKAGAWCECFITNSIPLLREVYGALLTYMPAENIRIVEEVPFSTIVVPIA